MRHTRLHVDLPLDKNTELTLPPDAARHAIRVLRLAPGDTLTLFNGDGLDYPAELTRVERQHAIVRTGTGRHPGNEPPWPLVVAQCLAKGDKMDLVIQKATELGATGIVPLVGERNEVRLDAARAEKRLRHWQGVATAACEQCGRARVPDIGAPVKLAAWLQQQSGDSALHLALMPGTRQRVRDLAIPSTGIILVVGPEGGLGARDTEALHAAGFTGLNLGPRVLRTETAALAALAAVLACHGDG